LREGWSSFAEEGWRPAGRGTKTDHEAFVAGIEAMA